MTTTSVRIAALLTGTALMAPEASGQTIRDGVPANTEVAAGAPGGDFAATGFSISVDGTPVAGATPPPVPQRVQDIALNSAAVDVTFDGLETDRRLAVAADRRAALPGQTVTFRAGTNYPAFLAGAEVVVLDTTQSGAPVVARVPIAPNGTAGWTLPANAPADMAYLLRVRDANGRLDETRAVPLTRGPGAALFVPPVLVEDETARRGIPLRGGTVTVSGTGGAPGGTVRVLGEDVAVDPDGTFAVDRILPPGDHVVAIQTGGRRLVRDVNIPPSEWFGTGIADLTLGREDGGPLDERRDVTDGRLAYYVKGRTAGGWTITSSADTQEGDIEDLFDRLNDKDPRRVLDRLRAESDDLYPTYGDDSTIFDDTPTQGNVYLRVENDTTRLTFGDFAAGVTGPGLIRNTRDLYGLEIRNQSRNTTDGGEPLYSVTAYAAQPDTLPQRDVLQGTNGSIYFLSRRDVLYGTAKVTVELRDANTGFVTESRQLTEGVDFEVDHLQGVIILSGPLTGFASDGTLIDEGGSDFSQSLVVQYEYTPTGNVPDQTAFGGRAEAWAAQNLRFGVTALRENTAEGEDQDMASVDMLWTTGEASFVQMEIAQTDGPGLNRAFSDDGGLTIGRTSGTDGSGTGLRAAARLDFGDLGLAAEGHVGARYEQLEQGFSTLTEDVATGRELFGLDGALRLSERAEISGAFEHYSTNAGEERIEGELALAYRLSQRLTAKVGLGHLDADDPDDADDTGSRTDAALRLSYAVSDALTLAAFGQTTVSRDGGLSDNDRFGLGVSARMGDRWRVDAEASDGDLGAAAQARLSYARAPGSETYIGYTLDPARTDIGSGLTDRGSIVLGSRERLGEGVSIWSESVLDRPGDQRSLTNLYGLSWDVAPGLTFGGSYETGRLENDEDGDIDRDAISVGSSYAPRDGLALRGRLEWRQDSGDGLERDRETWGVIASYTNQLNPEWRLLADVEALHSDSADDDFRDGEYVRANVGFAYRPIANERLNLVLGLTHLRDLPGEDQITVAGGEDGPEQISDVIALNASYDLTQRLTLGAKLAHRRSEVADRGTDIFAEDSATLAALRLDWHALHKWDILGEVRQLEGHDTGETATGALLGVYRHVNDHVKVGLLYELGDVSDDVTDLDYQTDGVYLNIIGKF